MKLPAVLWETVWSVQSHASSAVGMKSVSSISLWQGLCLAAGCDLRSVWMRFTVQCQAETHTPVTVHPLVSCVQEWASDQHIEMLYLHTYLHQCTWGRNGPPAMEHWNTVSLSSSERETHLWETQGWIWGSFTYNTYCSFPNQNSFFQ